MKTAQLYRAVQLTARASALLFAGSQATAAVRPPAAHASRPLYAAFMTAHAIHFVVVARYATATGGRNLFPGGRNLDEVGGWSTVFGIYSFFSGLAVTGWVTGAPGSWHGSVKRAIGHGAAVLIGAMFVGTYLGQLSRSRWYAVPATAVAGAVAANVLAQQRRSRRPL